MQLDTLTRNAVLDAMETAVGTSPTLEIRSGAAPAATTDADSGTLLCSLTLPSDWLANAASAAKGKSGTWTGTGVAGGTPGHYRIKASGGTVKMQGTAGVGSGELSLDTAVSLGGPVTINTANFAAGNA